MAGRLERVYEALQALAGREGISAQELAQAAGLDRSNASRELNRLALAGRVAKVPGKPVRFRPTEPQVAAPGAPVAPIAPMAAVSAAAAHLPPATPGGDPRPQRAPLDGLPGAEGSLRQAVALAKAAVLYPGGGLHTLILGPSGVGKSLFAEEMHRFAVAQEVLPPGAPFLVFNCADYAANPQLLLAQLFGSSKGAYTGASSDRHGMVEQAAGGLLFLDEVHRLPPEGQEMLFVLLDRAQFRRLGETTLRTVTVRVVCATTEDPESSLLGTFLRRIPMIIHLPALRERTASERLAIIGSCFQAEADRIGLPVEVSAAVVDRLLRHAPAGNVGQLKADIQLACARAFLEEVRQQSGHITVEPSMLPAIDLVPGPTGALPMSGPYHFVPGGEFAPVPAMGDSIYDRIARRALELTNEGRGADARAVIGAEIDTYFVGVTKADPAWLQAAERLVGQQVLAWAADMLELARDKLGLAIDPRARVGLGMHIASTLERVRQGKSITYPRLRELRQKSPREVAAASAMATRLQRLSGVALPADETGFLASFLLGLGGRARGQVGVLVICHGSKTATAQVETALELAGEGTKVAGINWPLGEPMDHLLQRAEAELRTVDSGQGVLLLVDMGPLVAVGELLTERTGISTRTVDAVTMLRLLEALRKARAADVTLDELARHVAEAATLPRVATAPGRPVLLVLCLTGEGSAKRLATMLGQSLPELAAAGVEIVTGALAGERSAAGMVADLSRERLVVAVVSTFDPGDLPLPVVLLEELLVGPGTARLKQLLLELQPGEIQRPAATPQPERTELLRQMTLTLARQFKRVDSSRVVPVVAGALQQMEARLGRPLSLDLFAGLAMHLACLVEEQQGSTAAPAPRGPLPAGQAAIAASLAELETLFGIQVPASHLERMAQTIGG